MVQNLDNYLGRNRQAAWERIIGPRKDTVTQNEVV